MSSAPQSGTRIETLVRDALATVMDPEIRRPITELDMVGSVDVVDGRAAIGIRLTIVGCPASDRIERDVMAAVLGVDGVEAAAVTLSVMTREERDALTAKLRGGRPKTCLLYTSPSPRDS